MTTESRHGNSRQFGLRHLLGAITVIGIALGLAAPSLRQPHIASGLAGIVAMAILLLVGGCGSVVGSRVGIRYSPTNVLGHAMAGGAIGWFLGNLICFAGFSMCVWIEQLVNPNAFRSDFGGPGVLMIFGCVCYGIPSIACGAITGLITYILRQINSKG